MIQQTAKFLMRIFCLMLLVCPLLSNALDLNTWLAQLHTMQAHFKQTVSNTKGRVIQKSNGTLAIEKPGKFRWDTQAPNKQLILSNARKIWVYDIDLAQVSINSVDKKLSQTPAAFLTEDNINLHDKYTITTNTDKSGSWYVLTPKDNTHNDFKSIAIRLDDEAIVAMRLQDNLGQITTIQFSQVALNKPLKPSLFEFNMPKDVDLIKQS